MVLDLLRVAGDPQHRFTCSRRGCESEAVTALRWANPRVHRDGRSKVWLACGEHLTELREFLAARDFLLQECEVSELDA